MQAGGASLSWVMDLFGGGADALRIDNPISSEMTHLRPDLLPGLLRAAARNQADVHAHAGGLRQGGCAMVAGLA